MVYIVGCIHDIQSYEEIPLLQGSPDVRNQRDRFRDLLAEILINEKIEFVGEEWGRQSDSIAQALKKHYELAYANINTTAADLRLMGIPDNYTLPHYTPAQKQMWCRQREQFMFGRIKELRGSSRNILVICGFDHMNSMAESSQQSGEPAKIIDYRKTSWYRNGVFFPTACTDPQQSTQGVPL